MILCNFATKRQADTCSRIGNLIVQTLKQVKYFFRVLRVESNAIVAHRDSIKFSWLCIPCRRRVRGLKLFLT